ncbi:hypothetical protein D922_03986 [Enterococcus faecalis 06-MB-DW-09]|nr:hypothetical protein D922_03986 [Enterococcus faecalis 06-MB-DW-09]
MKKKLVIILPFVFLSISLIFIYQTHNARKELQATLVSSETRELTGFEQLQQTFDMELTDLGEAFVSFVHFEEPKVAMVSTASEEFTFPISIVNSESHEFNFEDIVASPATISIGESFGLAIDEKDSFYYYSIE